VRARLGGLATQVAYAGAHCLAHLSAALSLLLLLELVRRLRRRPGGALHLSPCLWFKRPSLLAGCLL
jgi:hypothetical protein